MYSQNEEEKVILEYFTGKSGNFLDIGANDGITLSNTRALAELGWCGVFVEPSVQAFKKLKENYEKQSRNKCHYFYNTALGNVNKKLVFYDSGEHLGKGDTGLLGTFHESERVRFPKMKYTEVETQVYRWKTFFNRLSIKSFDFVSLDTEGNDRIILEQMDLDKLETKCICVEWNLQEHLRTWFTGHLKKYGMKEVYKSAENLIFVK